MAGNDACQGCFANTRWPVKQQIADSISRNGSTQETTLPQDRGLAHELIQAAGTHPVRQWSLALTGLIPLIREQILTQESSEPEDNSCAIPASKSVLGLSFKMI